MSNRIRQISKDPEHDDENFGPVERAFQDCHRQLLSAGCNVNLCEKILDEFAATVDATTNPTSGPLLPNEYIIARRQDSGMIYTMLLGEFCSLRSGQTLEREYYREIGIDKLLAELETLVVDFGALSNDIFSVEKEVVYGRDPHNLVYILFNNGMADSFEDALAMVVELVSGLMKEYQRLSPMLTERIKHDKRCDALSAYVKWMDMEIKACWTWQQFTTRYLSTKSVFLP